MTRSYLAKSAALALLAASGDFVREADAAGIDQIQNVVVLFLENRSFDNLYGHFPGANGIDQASQASIQQRDRDGSVLAKLPPVWKGLTVKGATPEVTQAATEHLANAIFEVDDPHGFNVPLGTITRDLWHRFYQNQMQINGGKNDMFVAWGDSGALPMGVWDGSKIPMWKVAQKYTLADNFMGAFGGSFLNHQWLICACAPYYPDADSSLAKPKISIVQPDGVTLALADNSPKSAMEGIPAFANDGNLTPDYHAVNTMQPPYQPSGNEPAAGGDPAFADPAKATTLPPQKEPTIGDLLSLKGVSWAWYGGGWQYVLENGNSKPVPSFQYHHQPFNYYATFAPGTAARAEHLRDGGLEAGSASSRRSMMEIAAGVHKPQGNLTEHSDYADIQAGEQHIADVVSHLESSPQWGHMLVIVTYDENGGLWDHVAPPRADRWGPGSRIPAIIISPFARKGFVDHTPYDTTSILRFITERFELPTLHGIIVRDRAVAANGEPPLGDLTGALDFGN
jgi:phospholipase C